MPLDVKDVEEVARTLNVELPTTQEIEGNPFYQIIGGVDLVLRLEPYLHINTINFLNFSVKTEEVNVQHNVFVWGRDERTGEEVLWPNIPQLQTGHIISNLVDWKLPISGGIILLPENYENRKVMSIFVGDRLGNILIVPATEIKRIYGIKSFSELKTTIP